MPVLAREVVELLVTDPDGIYVDATAGGGGHSRLILERLSERGRLIACDCDGEAISHLRRVLPDSVLLVRMRFAELAREVGPHVPGGASGVLMDLGVSSHQLDTARRGFSYRLPGPLDLRMDQTSGETAAQLLNRLDAAGLARVLGRFGEDPQTGRIARAIARANERRPIISTEHLTEVVSRAVRATAHRSLPRVFQALRIAVNHELEELENGLAAAWSLLRPGGRLVVISYHSLEDRITKAFMGSKAGITQEPSGLVPTVPSRPEGRLLRRKPVRPDAAEIHSNPRARSAKLRAIEKLN